MTNFMGENNLHLLIVDDDPDDLELFTNAIKEVDENIECVTARNGLEALSWLKDIGNDIPDLIFLDISMPLLNGRNCLNEIKKDQRLLAIPVIIYTTSKDARESVEFKKMGASHFISKPQDAQEIYYLVAVALEQYLFAQPNK